MRALATLIKIKNKEIDVLQVRIVDLEKEIRLLEKEIHDIEFSIKIQKEFVNSNPSLQSFFPPFYSNSRNLSMECSNQLIEKKSQINLLQEKLMEQFTDLKTYEIALEKIKKAEKNKLKIDETKILDELGLRKFTNSQGEGSD